MAAAAALVLCGCGGDRAAEEGASPPANEVSPPSEAPTSRTAPAPVPVTPETAASDSAAAAAQDLATWEQRKQNMESFASCMGKVRESPEAVRPKLEAACRRLPDATK